MKDWFSSICITPSSLTDWIQTGIGAIGTYALIRTLSLQRKTLDSQIKVANIEEERDRRQLLPVFKATLESHNISNKLEHFMIITLDNAAARMVKFQSLTNPYILSSISLDIVSDIEPLEIKSIRFAIQEEHVRGLAEVYELEYFDLSYRPYSQMIYWSGRGFEISRPVEQYNEEEKYGFLKKIRNVFKRFKKR
jgi:hypothetical protein